MHDVPHGAALLRRRWWFLAALGRCHTFGTFTMRRRAVVHSKGAVIFALTGALFRRPRPDGSPVLGGGVPAMVFGVTTPTASPLLAASDAHSICGLTHPARLAAAPILQVHTIDGAVMLLKALVVLARRFWGLGTPPPSMKRAGG